MKPVVAILLTIAAASAAAQPDRAGLARYGADDLKKMFLACDGAAATGLLGAGEAGACSLVYEELKDRVFRGDFQALVAWWKAQPREVSAQGAPARPARN
jgi:hypothetical protein